MTQNLFMSHSDEISGAFYIPKVRFQFPFHHYVCVPFISSQQVFQTFHTLLKSDVLELRDSSEIQSLTAKENPMLGTHAAVRRPARRAW